MSQKKEVALHVLVFGNVIKDFIGLRDTLKVLSDVVDDFVHHFEDTCTKTPSTHPYDLKIILIRTDDELPRINNYIEG